MLSPTMMTPTHRRPGTCHWTSATADALERAHLLYNKSTSLLIPAASFLGSFRDFHEPFLNELCHPRHGIRIDLDSGKHVFVSPVVNLRRRATQLKAHIAFHQVSDEVFVWI